MHVSIVEERRNVLRRKNTPAIQRNTRKGNRARICYYIRIFLKNFSSKPFSTIDAGSRVWYFPVLTQSLTRCTISSRLPLNFNPLHFNHRFSWSAVYSSGVLSNLEPETPSSSVRTVRKWSELLAISLAALKVSESRVGVKFHDVISAKRYRLVSLNG